MHARLTRFEGSPERIDDAVRQSQDVWLPKLRAIDGFQGVNTLADRSTGTIVSITYWESEDAMRASEETGLRGSQGRCRRHCSPGAADRPSITRSSCRPPSRSATA